MLPLLLLLLAWTPKNTDVHAKALASLPTRTWTTHVAKLGSTLTLTLPRIYVHAPHSGDVSKVTPIPAEACDTFMCPLSFHAETLALPTFSLRVGSMPRDGESNFGPAVWKCSGGRCVAQERKVSGCCARTEVSLAREVTPGSALICVGYNDVPRSDDDPSLVAWMSSVCEGIALSPDATTKR